MRIRTRAYLLGLLPALLMTLLLGGYLGLSRTDDLEAALQERGGALARHIAQGAEYAVASGNIAPLSQLLAWATQESDVAHIGVYRPDGAPVAEAGRKPAGLRVPLATGRVSAGEHIVFTLPVDLAALQVDDPFFQADASSSARASPRRIAWVQVVISRAGNMAIARQQVLATLGLVALGMLFTVMLVRGLVLGGIRPLMETISAVRGIAKGNFRVRLPTTAKSELRELQQGINVMSDALQSFEEDMQGRIDAATAELARKKEEAERANQAKSTFLAAASHDLRQPMHAVALYVESMKPQVAGQAAALTLAKIETAVAAMESLFGAILDVSKLDAGVVTPEISPVSVKAMLNCLHQDFRQEADAKGLRLRLHYRDDRVVSDPVLLGRILRNLISNALRYTLRGGVLIAARRRGGMIRFQVWDSGRGIPPEHMAHIFLEYFQLSNPRRDRSQGLGLGLAIVDRLARLLGHPLTVRSVPGKGTVFSLDVPASLGDSSRQERGREAPDGAARLRGLVAVVEDDAMVLDSLTTLLAGWGVRVISATSGEALLGKLAHAPDILITDFRLGTGDGLAVARSLRAAYPDAGFQVIVVTGDTSEHSVRRLNDSGHQILHKPVRPARLRALIGHLLGPAGRACPVDEA